MITIILKEEKPKACHNCRFSKWEWSFCTCILLNKTKEDAGKDYIFKCPCKG